MRGAKERRRLPTQLRQCAPAKGVHHVPCIMPTRDSILPHFLLEPISVMPEPTGTPSLSPLM